METPPMRAKSPILIIDRPLYKSKATRESRPSRRFFALAPDQLWLDHDRLIAVWADAEDRGRSLGEIFHEVQIGSGFLGKVFQLSASPKVSAPPRHFLVDRLHPVELEGVHGDVANLLPIE